MKSAVASPGGDPKSVTQTSRLDVGAGVRPGSPACLKGEIARSKNRRTSPVKVGISAAKMLDDVGISRANMEICKFHQQREMTPQKKVR